MVAFTLAARLPKVYSQSYYVKVKSIWQHIFCRLFNDNEDLMMKYLLQIDFPYRGPFGDQFFESMKELAEDIANEKGLVYKIWTENEETQEAGGIYVFDNLEDVNRYLEKHTQRLTSFGFTDIKSKVFIINEALSAITKSSL